MMDSLFIVFIVAFIMFIICALSYAAINLFEFAGIVTLGIMAIVMICVFVWNVYINNKEK